MPPYELIMISQPWRTAGSITAPLMRLLLTPDQILGSDAPLKQLNLLTNQPTFPLLKYYIIREKLALVT